MTHQYLNEGVADIATLSVFGKASQLNRLLRLSVPWDEGSYFGQASEWPNVARPEAGVAAAGAAEPQIAGATAAAGNLNGASDKFGAIAQAAQQAASAVQALPKGGAQALLAPLAQTALDQVAPTLLQKSIL